MLRQLFGYYNNVEQLKNITIECVGLKCIVCILACSVD
jgi:hypothetical protein